MIYTSFYCRMYKEEGGKESVYLWMLNVFDAFISLFAYVRVCSFSIRISCRWACRGGAARKDCVRERARED